MFFTCINLLLSFFAPGRTFGWRCWSTFTTKKLSFSILPTPMGDLSWDAFRQMLRILKTTLKLKYTNLLEIFVKIVNLIWKYWIIYRLRWWLSWSLEVAVIIIKQSSQSFATPKPGSTSSMQGTVVDKYSHIIMSLLHMFKLFYHNTATKMLMKYLMQHRHSL